MNRYRRFLLPALLVLVPGLSPAQESASFRVAESTFNAGGNPADGAMPASANHRVSFDAIGNNVATATASSASWSVVGGFVGWFPPPGEVANLHFTDATTMVWDPDPSVGDYGLYRGTITDPWDFGFGSCVLPTLLTATATITESPPAGQVHFYLVTARNQLFEESSKGPGRINPAACPR